MRLGIGRGHLFLCVAQTNVTLSGTGRIDGNAPDVKTEGGSFTQRTLSDAECAKRAAEIDAHRIRLH